MGNQFVWGAGGCVVGLVIGVVSLWMFLRLILRDPGVWWPRR